MDLKHHNCILWLLSRSTIEAYIYDPYSMVSMLVVCMHGVCVYACVCALCMLVRGVCITITTGHLLLAVLHSA